MKYIDRYRDQYKEIDVEIYIQVWNTSLHIKKKMDSAN